MEGVRSGKIIPFGNADSGLGTTRRVYRVMAMVHKILYGRGGLNYTT
jgi:hypothetical protein